MKKLIHKVLMVGWIVSILSGLVQAQDSPAFDLNCEVNKSYQGFTLSKEKLLAANIVDDLNEHYKSEWVKQYVRLSVEATCDGKLKRASSKNEELLPPIKRLLKNADSGTEIYVNVRYLPQNNLSYEEVKEMDFRFTVEPESDAQFAGGQQLLETYLKENILDKMPKEVFGQYQLAAVSFAVDEEGYVVEPLLSWSSENEQMDEIMLDAICNMPQWKPAQYADGTRIQQTFALSLGDHQSCVVNTLNIGKTNFSLEE